MHADERGEKLCIAKVFVQDIATVLLRRVAFAGRRRRSAFRLSADFVLNEQVIAQPVRRRVCRPANRQRRNR